MSDTFSVPKRRVSAQLVLPGGATRDVAVFLAEAYPGRIRGERLSELLNGGSQFIPVIDSGTNAVTFVRSDNLAVARVAADLEASDDAESLTIPTEHEVEVQMVDGQRLRGLITYVLPDSHSRLTDYLNSTPPFFPLIEGERVALVNKRHVAYVEYLSR